MIWTEASIKQAKRLHDSGLSWDEVGEQFKCSGGSVRSAVYRKSDASSVDTAAEAKKRLADLEKQVETLTVSLAKARRPKVVTPHKAPAKPEGSFIRVIVPDLHGCFHDKAAVGSFLHDLKALDPREVVLIGDLLDCGGFLAEHHTWGYVAESDYSFDDDIAAANMLLDEIQKAAPNAKFYYLEGNHERRIETWCLTSIMRSRKSGKNSKKDVNRLLEAFAPEHVLGLETRGIEFFKQGRFYHGCRLRATIKLGQCYFTHGTRCGANSARATLADFGAPVVYGHTHQIASATMNNVEAGSIAAWNIGCLSELQPMYGHDRKTAWNHGYGVQFVNRSGRFQHVTAHIVEGVSMLIPLTQMVA